MKLRFLASLSVLLAFGCTPSPTPGPATVSNTSSADVDISIPDVTSESAGDTASTEAAATETLVSFNVPDMH